MCDAYFDKFEKFEAKNGCKINICMYLYLKASFSNPVSRLVRLDLDFIAWHLNQVAPMPFYRQSSCWGDISVTSQ